MGQINHMQTLPPSEARRQTELPGVELRLFPFEPLASIPPATIAALQGQIPSNEIMDALLNAFRDFVGGTGIMSAFTAQYTQEFLIPNARSQPCGLLSLKCLATLYALLATGSLFVMDGSEPPEVTHYADLSSAALTATGVLKSPSIELVEALYLRAMLEFFRQGNLEELARVSLALAAQMCLQVRSYR
jgi:hypothetical protein